MGKRVEYAHGQRIGSSRLTYLHEVEKKTKGRRRALFRCDCGTTKEINIVHVVNGKIVSCGCYFNELIPTVNLKHGQSTRTVITGAYRSWLAMHRRVKVDPLYKDIHIDASWETFEGFYASMGDRPEGHSIERLDGTKDYTPANCIWATAKTQANNTTRNIHVTIKDKTKTIAEWCDIYGINRYTVYTRIRSGMDAVKAITTPLLRTKRQV